MIVIELSETLSLNKLILETERDNFEIEREGP